MEPYIFWKQKLLACERNGTGNGKVEDAKRKEDECSESGNRKVVYVKKMERGMEQWAVRTESETISGKFMIQKWTYNKLST